MSEESMVQSKSGRRIEVESPCGVGADEVEGEFGGAWFAVGRWAVGDRNGGGGVSVVGGEFDAYLGGVPLFDDDVFWPGAQEFLGDAVSGDDSVLFDGGESVVIVGGQGPEDGVGDLLEFALLKREWGWGGLGVFGGGIVGCGRVSLAACGGDEEQTSQDNYEA